MADGLPAGTVVPSAKAVALHLYDMGWATTVYDGEFGPFHQRQDLPDDVWLDALGRAGMRPLPCVGCYQSGAGQECMAGRCGGSSRLRLPPSAMWR